MTAIVSPKSPFSMTPNGFSRIPSESEASDSIAIVPLMRAKRRFHVSVPLPIRRSGFVMKIYGITKPANAIFTAVHAVFVGSLPAMPDAVYAPIATGGYGGKDTKIENEHVRC